MLCLFINSKEIRFSKKVSNLFVLKILQSKQLSSIALISRVASASTSILQPIKMLYKHLDYLSTEDLKKLVEITTDMQICNHKMSNICKEHVKDKQT